MNRGRGQFADSDVAAVLTESFWLDLTMNMVNGLVHFNGVQHKTYQQGRFSSWTGV